VKAIEPSGLESATGICIRPICPNELYEEL